MSTVVPLRGDAMHGADRERFRVAFVVGSLTTGGAEKQFLYGVAALRNLGVETRVYTLTRGEPYEAALVDAGIVPCWIGRSRVRSWRVLALTRHLRQFRPHIVQSTHFFTNLYVALAARGARRIGIGTLRNDTTFEVAANGMWGQALLRLPPVLIANSFAARTNAAALGRGPERIFVLPNAIDLRQFDDQTRQPARCPLRAGHDGPVAMLVARLVPQKRVDRFVTAVALARPHVPGLRGIVVGDGPERAALQRRADELGLDEQAMTFLGERDDVPSLLVQADVFVLTSEHEGLPNVVLEAMAARLPVVTTAAGDAARLVADGASGRVVRPADPGAIAAALVELAGARERRRAWGEAGRRAAEAYDVSRFGRRLLQTYSDIAERFPSPALRRVLPHPVA